jgi:hypothetical protein
MDITIRQKAGFGDIFYCQKIAVKLIAMGHVVYWPVIPEYQYVEQHITNGIIWHEADHPTFELDLENATSHVDWKHAKGYPDNLMQSKYSYANQHFYIGGNKNWNKYFKIDVRHNEKEQALCDLLIKPEHANGFCLCNRHFATECYSLRKLEITSKLPMIEIVKIPNFQLFDWCRMIELAKEIRIPDSSFPYIVEILETTGKLYMYNRDTETHIRTKDVWHKKWKFVE